jgi:type III secretion protein C
MIKKTRNLLIAISLVSPLFADPEVDVSPKSELKEELPFAFFEDQKVSDQAEFLAPFQEHIDSAELVGPITPYGEVLETPEELRSFPGKNVFHDEMEANHQEEHSESSRPCPEDHEQQGYVIDFKDIPFVEYLRFLSKVTNTNFIFDDEDVQFNVTVVCEEPTNIDDVRSVLMQILRTQGLSLLEQGNNVLIHKNPDVKAAATVVSDEMHNLCDHSEALITRVFRLKNSNADKLAQIIQPMVSSEALVEPSSESHHLIVTDVSSNVQKIANLLESLDNPDAAFEVGTYHARTTYVENLIPLAEKILFPLSEGNPIVMVPQTVSDTIFIVSTPYLVHKSIEILGSLDGGFSGSKVAPEGHPEKTKFLVYKLQFHKGSQIQETLQEVGADLARTGAVNLGLMNTINTAQWLEATNSLLFVGDEESLKKVKELLEALDAPLRQVFIEVLAIRTSISNSIEIGVQYGLRGRRNDQVVASGSLFTTPDTAVAGKANKPTLISNGLDLATGPLIPVPKTPNAMGLTGGVIGNVIKAGGNLYFDVAALISAMQTDDDTEVIMNPKIVAQDTVPSTLYVGSTRPFQTNSILQASGSSSGNYVTASIEYRQLGMSLTVTPYIGSSDMITMEIEHKTSDFVKNAIGDSSSGSSNFTIVPITNDSSTTTRVHVPNEHFLVLSGMLEDTKQRTKVAIPCLGGLPIIGNLLGTRANNISKDNLIIFLRPHIIDTAEQMDELTKREDVLYQEKNKKQSFIKNSAKLWNLK